MTYLQKLKLNKELEFNSGRPVFDESKFVEKQAQGQDNFFLDVKKDTLRRKIATERRRIEEAVKLYEERN